MFCFFLRKKKNEVSVLHCSPKIQKAKGQREDVLPQIAGTHAGRFTDEIGKRAKVARFKTKWQVSLVLKHHVMLFLHEKTSV